MVSTYFRSNKPARPYSMRLITFVSYPVAKVPGQLMAMSRKTHQSVVTWPQDIPQNRQHQLLLHIQRESPRVWHNAVDKWPGYYLEGLHNESESRNKEVIIQGPNSNDDQWSPGGVRQGGSVAASKEAASIMVVGRSVERPSNTTNPSLPF